MYNTNTREVQYQVSQFNLQEVTEYGARRPIKRSPSPNALTSNDLTVYGNLLVQGKTTYLNVENKRIADPIIEIASNNAVAEHEFDAGIIVTRRAEATSPSSTTSRRMSWGSCIRRMWRRIGSSRLNHRKR